jgi:S-adenosylmethionine:tRNA-ribosyltransferase-isomerase (queuine synthetase)
LALVWELIVTNFHVPVGSMAPLSAAMLRAETI